MKININEIKFKIKLVEGEKHPNLLAYATLIFQEESGEYFTISGFTLWKSKYGGYNLEVPSNKGFKHCLFEKSFKQKIKQEIIKQYEYESIPLIEEKKK